MSIMGVPRLASLIVMPDSVPASPFHITSPGRAILALLRKPHRASRFVILAKARILKHCESRPQGVTIPNAKLLFTPILPSPLQFYFRQNDRAFIFSFLIFPGNDVTDLDIFYNITKFLQMSNFSLCILRQNSNRIF